MIRRGPIVCAVGGGKGGIGKSFISSHLAFYLSSLSQVEKIIAIDLDLGASNLHTYLKHTVEAVGIEQYFQRRKGLSDLVVPTIYKNLYLITGERSFWGQYTLSDEQVKNLMVDIRQLNSDFVILDLGAGTHPYTLDFFLEADEGILVVIHEPTSVENSYVFLKGLFFRILQKHTMSFDYVKRQGYLEQMKSPREILYELRNYVSDEFTGVSQDIQRIRINIVLNQVRDRSELALGESMQNVVKNYFLFRSRFLHAVSYEKDMYSMFKKNIQLNPYRVESMASRDIQRMANMFIEL